MQLPPMPIHPPQPLVPPSLATAAAISASTGAVALLNSSSGCALYLPSRFHPSHTDMPLAYAPTAIIQTATLQRALVANPTGCMILPGTRQNLQSSSAHGKRVTGQMCTLKVAVWDALGAVCIAEGRCCVCPPLACRVMTPRHSGLDGVHKQRKDDCGPLQEHRPDSDGVTTEHGVSNSPPSPRKPGLDEVAAPKEGRACGAVQSLEIVATMPPLEETQKHKHCQKMQAGSTSTSHRLNVGYREAVVGGKAQFQEEPCALFFTEAHSEEQTCAIANSMRPYTSAEMLDNQVATRGVAKTMRESEEAWDASRAKIANSAEAAENGSGETPPFDSVCSHVVTVCCAPRSLSAIVRVASIRIDGAQGEPLADISDRAAVLGTCVWPSVSRSAACAAHSANVDPSEASNQDVSSRLGQHWDTRVGVLKEGPDRREQRCEHEEKAVSLHACWPRGSVGATDVPVATTLAFIPAMEGLAASLACGMSSGVIKVVPVATAAVGAVHPLATGAAVEETTPEDARSKVVCRVPAWLEGLALQCTHLQGHQRTVTCLRHARLQHILQRLPRSTGPPRGSPDIEGKLFPAPFPAQSASPQPTPHHSPSGQTPNARASLPRSRWARAFSHRQDTSHTHHFSIKSMFSTKLPHSSQQSEDCSAQQPSMSPLADVTPPPFPSAPSNIESLGRHPSMSLSECDTPLQTPPPTRSLTQSPITETLVEEVLFSGCAGGRLCCWSIPTAAQEPSIGVRPQHRRQLFTLDALAEPIWDVVLPAQDAPAPWNRCACKCRCRQSIHRHICIADIVTSSPSARLSCASCVSVELWMQVCHSYWWLWLISCRQRCVFKH
jgi:hypothetical protein